MEMLQAKQDNINNSFFKSIYKDVWPKLVPAGLTEAETDFIEDVAGLTPGNFVLDIMCGYGRHAFELAKRGYDVTAVDNLKEYTEEIKINAQKENLQVQAILSGAKEVELTRQFHTVICMGNSFAFFNEAEAIEVVKKISDHLHPEGTFIIGTWMLGEIAIKHFKEKDWYYVDDYKYLIDSKFLFHPTRIESEHIVVKTDGTPEIIKGIDYIFTISEMEKIFETCGLRLKDVYSTPRKRKFRLGDASAYLVAEKF